MAGFREALRKVEFGPGSWALLALLAGSAGDLIQRWVETGEVPDVAAWRTALLGVALAGLRSWQAVAQTKAGSVVVEVGGGFEHEPDDDLIPGGEPGEVS